MKFLLVPALLLSSVAFAQAPLTVKSSPAADALVHAASDLQNEQNALTTILNQARSTNDASQKAIQEELKKANDELLAELRADKKYKDKLAAIDVLQKNMQDAGQVAEQKFEKEAGPIQNEIGKNKALVDGLIPIVRKENDLPDTATFDPATQKWATPAKVAEKPVEPKK